MGCLYQLVLFDRLSAADREALGDLPKDPDFYGVLRPRAEGCTFKTVGKETALLLLTLTEPGPIPAYVLNGHSASNSLVEIKALILDGVLEMRGANGFVSGPEAMNLIQEVPSASPSKSFLSRLSHRALLYAETLGIDDIEQLADRLYAFHRVPVSPRWQRRLGDAGAVQEYLGIGYGSPLHRRLSTWGHSEKQRNAGGWLGWSEHGKREADSAYLPTYKLYISPATEALKVIFERFIDTLLRSRGTAFKLGGDAAGLLRPDKLIVYFEDFDSLSQTANELTKGLEGVRRHGVPFTAEIAGDGLLSWGLDPPRGKRTIPWQTSESWRMWIVRRLAAALITAQSRPSDNTAPWRFALERLHLQGIDVEHWTPRPTLWRHEE